jgi:spermidine synthase
MAKKAAGADFGFREADARGKTFDTLYYSADIHKGAQHLPPFVAKALAD